MVPPCSAVLHAGHAPALPLMEYLLRVLLHVIGIGVIAALAIGWSPVVHWLRSRLPAGHPRDDDG